MGGGLSVFCRNDITYIALEVSNSNTEVIEHVHVKLHRSNMKINYCLWYFSGTSAWGSSTVSNRS